MRTQRTPNGSWNAERGYGFVGDDSGGPDLFLHASALESADIDPLTIRKGDRLSMTWKAPVRES
jgi:cold shock CspA family protein